MKIQADGILARHKCRGCKKQFSVKVGTIFHDSPLGLDKWMVAMWMLANCRNGISSYEIARTIGISKERVAHDAPDSQGYD